MYLLLVDAQTISADELKNLSNQLPAGKEMVNTFNAQTLVTLAENLNPEILIIDINLIEENTESFLETIKEKSNKAKIIALFETEQLDSVNEVIDSGIIDDYLLKPLRKEDLIARLHLAAKRLPSADASLVETLAVNEEAMASGDLLQEEQNLLMDHDLPAEDEMIADDDADDFGLKDFEEEVTEEEITLEEFSLEPEPIQDINEEETKEDTEQLTDDFGLLDFTGEDAEEPREEVGSGEETVKQDDLFDFSSFEDEEEDKEEDDTEFYAAPKAAVSSEESSAQGEDIGDEFEESTPAVEEEQLFDENEFFSEQGAETKQLSKKPASEQAADSFSDDAYAVKATFDTLFEDQVEQPAAEKPEKLHTVTSEPEEDIFAVPGQQDPSIAAKTKDDDFDGLFDDDDETMSTDDDFAPINNETDDTQIEKAAVELKADDFDFFADIEKDSETDTMNDPDFSVAPASAPDSVSEEESYFEELFQEEEVTAAPAESAEPTEDGFDFFADEEPLPASPKEPVERQSPFPGESADDFLFGDEEEPDFDQIPDTVRRYVVEKDKDKAVTDVAPAQQAIADDLFGDDDFTVDTSAGKTDRAEKKRIKSGSSRRTLNIIGNIVFALLLLMMATLSFFLIQSRISGGAPQVAGYQIYIVLSGSMSPEFDTGSLAFVRETAPEELVVGDIITFRSQAGSDSLTTHRIVEVLRNGELNFITRGDANNVNDPNPVAAENVVGRVTGSVPYLGYILNFVQTRQGLILLIFVPGVLIILFELGKILKYLKEDRESSRKLKKGQPGPAEDFK